MPFLPHAFSLSLDSSCQEKLHDTFLIYKPNEPATLRNKVSSMSFINMWEIPAVLMEYQIVLEL